MAKAQVSITLSNQGYSNTQVVTELTQGVVTIDFAQGTGSDSPAYYTSGSALRTYAYNTINVSVPAGYRITEIIFTCTGNNNVFTGSCSTGEYTSNGAISTWSGNAESIKFTNSSNKSSAQLRIKKIDVTYTSPAPTTNYTTLSALLANIKTKAGQTVSVETPMSVIYESNAYRMLTDGTRNMLIQGFDEGDYPVGTKVSKVTGRVTNHESHYELTSVDLVEGGEGASIEAEEVTSLNDINHQDNIYDLIVLKGCSISDFDGSNGLITFNGEVVELNNAFEYQDIENRENVTLTGFIIRWNEEMNIIPIDFVADPVAYVLPDTDLSIPANETIDIPLGKKYPSVITYKSNNEDIVTVDEDGNITGVAPGKATVTLTWEADKNFTAGTADIKVTVTEALSTAVLCHSECGYEGDIEEQFVVKSKTDPSYVPDVLTLTHTDGSFVKEFRFVANSKFTITPAQDVTINKIIFRDINTGSPEITVNNGEITNEGRVYTWKGSADQPIVFSTTAMVHVYFFEVYYSVEPLDASKTPVNMTWSETTVNVTKGKEYTLPELTLDNEDARSAVRYKSENKDAATIDERTGEVTLVGDGVTLIRAYIPEDNETYAASRTSYLLTVVDETKSVINVEFLGNTSTAYDLDEKTDNMGVVYQAVFSVNGEYIAFNTSNKKGGKSSALIVKDNTRNGHIIKSVTINFGDPKNGVDIYAQDKNFASLENTYSSKENVSTAPDLGDAQKITTLKANGRVEINKAAFAIVPAASGMITISSITVQYSDDKVCMLTPEELTPEHPANLTLAADGTGVMQFNVNKNHGMTLHFKHEPKADPASIISTMEHEGFTQATITEGDGDTDLHEFQVPSAGKVTYYGYHTATGTKGVERTVTADIPTGVEGVAADAAADAVYFNLQGVKVDSENLVPGIYVRRAGDKAEKVVVK